MAKYYLCSNSKISGKNIHMENIHLSEIDKFIYNNFQNMFELQDYFRTDNSDFKIYYIYNKTPRFVDLILKDSNVDFFTILNKTKGCRINSNLDNFRYMINDFINKTTIQEIKFLFDKNYIDHNTFDNFMLMKNNSKNGIHYHRDMAELFSYLKDDLRRYLYFRKFYSGLVAYQKSVSENTKPAIITKRKSDVAKTSDEMVNDLYNNGGLDELYSLYDLDELNKLVGRRSLNIDGIGKRK